MVSNSSQGWITHWLNHWLWGIRGGSMGICKESSRTLCAGRVSGGGNGVVGVMVRWKESVQRNLEF